jgi:hypothetical protein
MFFMYIICNKSPFGQVCGSPSLLHTNAYRVYFVYNSGTIRVQICSNSMVFWSKIDIIDSFFPLFPYLLIYRTQEVEGSDPSRSTEIPPQVWVFIFYAYIWGKQLGFRVIIYIVCNRVQRKYLTEMGLSSLTSDGVFIQSIGKSVSIRGRR